MFRFWILEGMKQLIFIFCLVSSFYFPVFSQQNNTNPNSLDDVYQPAGNSLFNQENLERKDWGRLAVPMTIGVKLIPFQLMRGSLLAETEIAFRRNASLLLGVGYQITNDFVLQRFNNSYLSNSNSTNFIAFNELLNNSEFAEGGMMYLLAFRTYSDKLQFGSFNNYYGNSQNSAGKTMNDWYQSFVIMYNSSSYRIDTSAYYHKLKIVGSDTFKASSLFVQSGLGFSYALSGRVKTIHDFYLHLGLRVIRYTKYEINRNFNPSTSLMNEYFLNTGSYKLSMMAPSIHFGYSIGIGL